VRGVIITLILLTISSVVASYSDELENNIVFQKKYEFIIEKSCEDIRSNMDVMLNIYKEIDAGIATAWRVSVAKKIPSQPVATVQLLSKAGVKAGRYCLDPFFEADTITLKTWFENSIGALETFTMKDAKEEAFRCQCLEEIKSEYAEFTKR
jgi:hypothetical protein